MARDNLANHKEEYPTGFIYEEDKPDELWYMYDSEKNLLFLTYGDWEVDRFVDFDGRRKMARKTSWNPIVIDLETRVLYIYTGKISKAIRIINIMESSLGELPYNRVHYPFPFMTWLVEHGLEHSPILITVGRTKVDNIETMYEETRRLTIDPKEHVRDTHFWQEVRTGRIIYSQCKFLISDFAVPVLVYNSGKYTITSTRGASEPEIAHYLRHVYLELNRLRKIWEKEEKLK